MVYVAESQVFLIFSLVFTAEIRVSVPSQSWRLLQIDLSKWEGESVRNKREKDPFPAVSLTPNVFGASTQAKKEPGAISFELLQALFITLGNGREKPPSSGIYHLLALRKRPLDAAFSLSISLRRSFNQHPHAFRKADYNPSRTALIDLTAWAEPFFG